MLCELGKKPNSILNYTLYILTTKHYIDKFMLKKTQMKQCTGIVRVDRLMTTNKCCDLSSFSSVFPAWPTGTFQAMISIH